MNRPKRRVDLCSVLDASARAAEWFQKMEKMVQDADRETRLMFQECPVCFASQKAGGAELTMIPCAICEKELNFGNGCVDVMCLECAREKRLCKHCGGDIEMKQRRKL